jgi:hypothetical protein
MKRLHFVVSLITDENDHQRQQAAAAQEATTRLGIDVKILFARTTPFIRASSFST